jgi:uncharacterized protein (TIGR02118 family)
MYKIVATWSAPPAERVEEFEKHYADVHVPRAQAVPHLRRIVLTRTTDGLPGGSPEFYRVAEMFFDSPETMAKSAESAQWRAMREDAGQMIEEFGVALHAAAGWESE